MNWLARTHLDMWYQHHHHHHEDDHIAETTKKNVETTVMANGHSGEFGQFMTIFNCLNE